MSPEEDGFAEAFAQSLCRKHRQLTGQAIDAATVQFRLLSVPKSRLITIRAGKPQETRVRGYMFEFELVAPPGLHRTGFMAGFGEKSSMGFGCVAQAETARKRVVMEGGRHYEQIRS
jgi:CRISPR-associated endoribonuclease Cas6